MRVLIAVGSKRGGTKEIAAWVAATLRQLGHDVDVRPAAERGDIAGYDAVLVGGALYLFRWHRHARRFVERHAAVLRTKEVWFFSSGPLDTSARDAELAPVAGVKRLMDLVGANGHATFGGRIEPGAGTPLAKTHTGDWRDAKQVEAWARELGRQLVAIAARPQPRPARAPPPPEPRAWALIALCLFAGASALFGGAALVARPDGSLLGLPVWLLEHSPFESFRVPGVLLFLFVGLGNVWAAWLHLRRYDLAAVASFASGATLVGWIIVQMIMLRSFHPLQVGSLLLGLAIVGVSGRYAPKFPTPPKPVSHA